MLTSVIHRLPDAVLQADGRLSQDQSGADCNRQIDAAPGAAISALLPAETFACVVANAPLVAIDLIVEDMQGAMLLGLRNNPPAKGYWFVPGGRIRKNETLDAAFARITQDELGLRCERTWSRLGGIYEHFYDTDFIDTSGATTHYIVLAYRLQIERKLLQLPLAQHSRYSWIQPNRMAQDPHVHPYTKAYFPS